MLGKRTFHARALTIAYHRGSRRTLHAFEDILRGASSIAARSRFACGLGWSAIIVPRALGTAHAAGTAGTNGTASRSSLSGATSRRAVHENVNTVGINDLRATCCAKQHSPKQSVSSRH